MNNTRALAVEFVGTFFLVFTIGMVVIEPGVPAGFAPIAIGTILAVMIFAGGHISGAHYNPAVTLGIFLRGKIELNDAIAYWITQLVAGVAARGAPAIQHPSRTQSGGVA